ncbi:hypothetical protein [Pleomorphomonas sp. PLEO]|uniref:hypothetical protein n=1 Tax=Pleomorphomonas sp. PLEO TaxID=3239306 RepID=UPI00351E954C
MSSAAGSSGITSQIWQRLVRQGDTNSDNNLSKAELDTLKAGFKDNADIEQIIRSFDKDGDQNLSSSELPSSPLDVEMLGPMLDWQEYGKADATTRSEDDKRVVDSLFARADVDGDGFLSKDEMEAESTLRRTRSLEGKSADSDPVYMIRPDADRDHLSPEDFLVGRRIPSDRLKIIPPEKVPAEVREAIQKAAEEWKSSPDYQKPLTAEEQRQKSVDGVLSTPLSAAYISRLLSQLSAAVAKADPANALRSSDEGTKA